MSDGITTSVAYALGGIMANGTLCVYDGRGGGSFIMGATAESLKVAKKWKTRAGVERFVLRETAAGSNWTYCIIMIDA